MLSWFPTPPSQACLFIHFGSRIMFVPSETGEIINHGVAVDQMWIKQVTIQSFRGIGVGFDLFLSSFFLKIF